MDTVNEQENYRLLGDLVVNLATRKMQKIFLARYEAMTNEKWGQKPSSAKQFFENRPHKERLRTYKNVTPEDRKKLEGDALKWDITLLDLVLSNIDFSAGNTTLKDQHDEENKHIKAIKTARNEYSHPTQKQIPQPDFEVLWEKAETALVALGASKSEIDDIKATRVVTSFKLYDPPTNNFTGRTDLLKKIHQQMLECSTKEDCLDRIVVLSGLGGMGKSELARVYAHTYITHPIIQNVAWIDAEELTGMKASFVSLAKKFKIPTKNKELEEIIEEVYDHFSNNVQTGLFIFDNSKQMNDRPFGIYEYLPIQESIKTRPLLLLTARDRDWDIPNENNVIPINELSQEESIELLEKKFRLTKEDTNYNDYIKLVAKLANALQGYPLGLALATSNIVSNKNWTGLKAEIEAYLERMREPGGDWIEDDQIGAATKYKLIMENVWEVTLEKIKASGTAGQNAVKLLNIIAYFPPDQIQKDQIERIFKTFYSPTALSSRVFNLLEKYSLIKIETREEYYRSRVTHLIRIHRLVQLTTREKMDRENELSYLLRLCGYFSYTEYNQEYRDKDMMMGLHEFLKDRKWPEKSIQFSLIFCSVLTSTSNVEDALNLAEDIYTFLNMDAPEKARIVYGEDVINFYFLCMFWINQNKYVNQMRDKLIFNKDKLERMFVSIVVPATAFVLTSTDDPKSLQEHSYLLCVRLLPRLIRSHKGPTCELISMIISTLNETRCCSLKYISNIYKTLWECFNCRLPESLTLLEPVLQKHFEIYSDIHLDDPNYSEAELSDYWGDDMPLDLFFIYLQLEDEKNRENNNGKRGHFKGTNEFLEKFIQVGGHKILCQHIQYLTKYNISLGDTYIIFVIRSLALYLSARTTLTESVEFCTAFSDFTEMILEDKYQPRLKFACIMSWFSLFARKKPRILLADGRCAPSIHSIAPVLNEMLNKIKTLDSDVWLIFDDFDNEGVLRTFLETYIDEPDCLAVRTASRVLKDDKSDLRHATTIPENIITDIDIPRLEETIQSLQLTNENPWRLLSILAYLKGDTSKAKVEAMFRFAFNQHISEDAFIALKDKSLLSIVIKKGWPPGTETDWIQIQINDSVKLYVRNELLVKNEYVALLGVSNFEISMELMHCDKRNSHFRTVHEYLKDFKWPQSSTHLSMIFSLFLTQTSLGFNNNSVSLIEDVYEFLNSSEAPESTEISWYNTEYFKLFQLCTFWVKLNQIDETHVMWADPNLSKNSLERNFVLSIEPSIKNFMNPQTNLLLFQSFLLGTPWYILKLLPKQMKSIEPELRENTHLSILEAVSDMTGCVTEHVTDLFRLLWDFYKNASASDSVKYLRTIFKKHFEIYTSSFILSTEARLDLYWDYAGPLNLKIVMKACKNYSDAEKYCILDCFFAHDGDKIIIDYFIHTGKHERGYNLETYLFSFIQMMAFELGFAEKLIESPGFLVNFSKYTPVLIEDQGGMRDILDVTERFTCLTSWFALFARHVPDENDKECDFFFNVVALDLEKLFTIIMKRDLVPESSKTLLLAKEVLNTFLKTFSNKSNSKAFKTAAGLLDLVQFHHSLMSEDKENSL